MPVHALRGLRSYVELFIVKCIYIQIKQLLCPYAVFFTFRLVHFSFSKLLFGIFFLLSDIYCSCLLSCGVLRQCSGILWCRSLVVIWRSTVIRRTADNAYNTIDSTVPQVCCPMSNFFLLGQKFVKYSRQNLEFCPQICPSGATCLHNFYKILSSYTRKWVAFNFLIWSLSGDKQASYKHFSSMGAFLHKFPMAKLLLRSQNVGGAKVAPTSSVTKPSMVGILHRALDVDK